VIGRRAKTLEHMRFRDPVRIWWMHAHSHSSFGEFHQKVVPCPREGD
jgi:hypothetical protein